MKTLIFVGIGGAIGSILRYLTGIYFQKMDSGNFPLATFIANAIGCLLIGLFMGYLTKNNLVDSQLKWFLVTGFCGGFTTFSTFGYENIQLVQQQQYLLALTYTLVSVCVGITAVFLGLWFTR
ncbi:MAG: fluoride efflux transporter CrcB [Flavobacterium stagni]|uniref:fluoride efflux transporter CrcB n=1 Tax=Flavobacterium sp. N1719 TaxID=2885633 RepID=UPI002222AAF8|nr:fluoride efflux transporter CrcB [Flavobacterium sp. N1719]